MDRKITVAFGYTVNLGNYESARVDYSMEVVASASDIDLRASEAMEKCKAFVRTQVKSLLQNNDIRK